MRGLAHVGNDDVAGFGGVTCFDGIDDRAVPLPVHVSDGQFGTRAHDRRPSQPANVLPRLHLLHTAITVVGIVTLIVGARLNPVIVLVLGSLYLGLATGLGFDDTATAVAEGFGKLMAEVGLIIGFGVLLGSILSTTPRSRTIAVRPPLER